MKFLIICGLLLLSFFICVFYIRSRWSLYAGGIFGVSSLRSYNALSRVWPCDDGFMSLIFSALRHTLIPLVFAALIWFINKAVLSSLSLLFALLYAVSIIPRYHVRKRDFNEAGDVSKEMLRPVKSACFSVMVCSFANYMILLLCYGLRP